MEIPLKLNKEKFGLNVSAGLCRSRERRVGLNREQNYSNTCSNTCDFSSDLIANFCNLMLIINMIKPKENDLTDIYFIKLHYM